MSGEFRRRSFHEFGGGKISFPEYGPKSFKDLRQAWTGALPYDPARVRAPVAIIRGDWDHLIPDADARWLFDAFAASLIKRDVKISRATHLMHLECMRWALHRESIAFLEGGDEAPMPR